MTAGFGRDSARARAEGALAGPGNFFSALPGLQRLTDAGDARNYVEPPASWWVVITDVVRSTEAIEAGRYRDVNLAGAASSVALRSVMGDEPFPFAFGGDGATALVPGERREAIAEALKALRNQIQQTLGLELRVGMVPVAALREAGFALLVARHAISRRFPLAFFVGQGFTEAEAWVKEPGSRWQLDGPTSLWVDLRDLSCRWQAMPSRRGVVLTLIVRPRGGDPDAYRALLEELATVLDHDLASYNPVHLPGLRYTSLRGMWAQDRRLTGPGWQRLLRMIVSLVAWLLFRLGVGAYLRRVQNYINQTAAHSDFHKLQDRLCMVLDCTEAEADAVEALCERAQGAGRLQYGAHRSSTAVMTCLVGGFDDGEHVHFIDGGDGGYALAAKAIKAQRVAS